jgi:hypothetical protein
MLVRLLPVAADDAEGQPPRGAAAMPVAARRAAAVIILLAVAAAGLRARGAFSAAGSPPAVAAAGHVVTVLFGIAEGAAAIACVLLLAMVFRRPRRRKPEEDTYVPWTPPVPWWVRALTVALTLAVLAGPAVLLAAGAHGRHGRRPALPGVPHLGAPPGGAAHPGTSGAGSAWPVIAGMAIAAAIALALAVAARRRPAAHAAPVSPPAGPSPLEAGVQAGSEALRGGGDARQAIIACYAAMERGLAGAGSPPAAADTPAEVLARAAAAGLVRSGAAATLTSLFRRARYSPHPVSEADRDAAASALDRLRADLAGLAGRGAAP